jgi:signal transduction histidine kinase
MQDTPSSRRWPGPPLVLQILGLLLAGLVIAQIVTLFLTMILPPAPSPQHSLAEVAAALQGARTGESRHDILERVVQSGPPDLTGAGWLISTRSEKELAQRLGVAAGDVRLAFYTPLPFAGTSPAPKFSLKADDGPVPGFEPRTGVEQASFVILAQATVPPRMDHMPAGVTPPPHDGFPPGLFPGGPRDDMRTGMSRRAGGFGRGGEANIRHRTEPLIAIDPTPAKPGDGGIWIGGDHGEAVPEILRGANMGAVAPTTSANTPIINRGAETLQLPPIDRLPGQRPFFGPMPMQAMQLPDRTVMTPLPRALPQSQIAPIGSAPAPIEMPRAPQRAFARAATAPPSPPIVQLAPPPPKIIAQLPEVDIRRPDAVSTAEDPLIPLSGRAGGLFGLAPAPFVEGDFVAALRLGDGKWAVVQPSPEPFPNVWQRRVLLWFVIAFAVVAPVGWLFARRIVKPLAGFAAAAELLGRDPSAQVLDLDGPAEVGRAARAFNVMQSRLKSFVDDRTAMIGAISHDLRTPLTRLRFRIEDVEDDHIRDGMIEEVEQMEQMITSVLNFIREASSPGVRERLDLRMIVDDVIEDAALVGSDVAMESADPAPVEVDVLGMKRLFANLVDNAVKYGDRARVRLSVDAGEAVAEVTDDGPGVPEEDLERAFEPFYRAANALSSDKRGNGLGLAVCRSIARAHGGDVRLLRSKAGFTAQLRVPLAFNERAAA